MGPQAAEDQTMAPDCTARLELNPLSHGAAAPTPAPAAPESRLTSVNWLQQTRASTA